MMAGLKSLQRFRPARLLKAKVYFSSDAKSEGFKFSLRILNFKLIKYVIDPMISMKLFS